jgi:hypothetical protein
MKRLSCVPTRAAPAATAASLGGARGAFRWVCTKNPFYVISAGLFLLGLWFSYGEPARPGEPITPEETWARMAWLAGYTLLLAGTAYLLVRFARVWDDVRTVLLLVVLMFLATSVTFDHVLAYDPKLGIACCLIGLGFAIAVSEGLLRGIGLELPAWFRGPYYLILALFFLYPLALIPPAVHEPLREARMWGLFGFASAAGLVFLSLLPAVRRGPEYVRANGSPWGWPLYPWTLFGMLALAVPARSFLLCWSMHHPEGGPQDQLIFGPFFLVPFGLAASVLLLEIAVVSRHGGALLCALSMPAGLIVLATAGYRPDPIYERFLRIFAERLGGTPLYWTLWACAAFYAYAALRRLPGAVGALSAVLMMLVFVAPDNVGLSQLGELRPAPLLAVAILQLAVGIRRRDSWHCLAGSLAAVLALSFPGPYRGMITFHLVLIAVWLVGAAFDDAMGRFLRLLGAVMVLLGSLVALVVRVDLPWELPPWTAGAYPLAMAAALVGYGLLLRHRPSLLVAGLILVCWFATAGWQGYRYLRRFILGLDYIALSLGAFAVAVAISLGKSGVFKRVERN